MILQKPHVFGKISFSSNIQKRSVQIRLQDFLSFDITKTIWGIKSRGQIGDIDFEERFGPSMCDVGFKWYTFENL